MKFIQSFISFLNEKKEEKDFEDKIKDHGYFKGISTSTARKKMAQMKAQADMPDDDPDAYKEMPGSTKGKKLIKPSKHTKNYQELYGDEEEIKNESIINWDLYQKIKGNSGNFDMEIKYPIYERYSLITATGLSKENKEDLQKMGVDVKLMGPGWYLTVKDSDKKKVLDYLAKENIPVNESVDENASGDRGPIDSGEIEKALKKKSEETGVPLPLLRIVMRRGMAAWKSGHRPGAGQEQWGYARVNSFLTKAPGTWGRPLKDPVKGGPKGAYGADADVAKEVIDGGHDKNLKKG
jgi:hypothetical protein